MQLVTPIMLTWMIQSTSFSVMSVTFSKDVAPALAKSSETGPSAFVTSSRIAITASRSMTSHCTGCARPPLSVISFATAPALSYIMSVTPTAAPSAPSSSASPWPMPLPPPVTTATRPAISVIISSFYFWQHLVRETLELVIDQLIRQAAEAEICQHLIIAHHLFTDQMMLDQIFRRADHIAGDIIPVGLVRTAGLLGHGAHISVGGVGGQGLKMVAHEFIMIRHGCEHAAKIF